MFNFKEWLVLHESSQVMISGPGIKKMQDTFHDMAGRGAPKEKNDFGFNKPDWNFYISNSQYMDAEEIPLTIARQMISTLMKYKKTQLPNYEQLKQEVEEDIRRVTAAEALGNKIIVYDNEPLGPYNKIAVYIPGLDTGKKRKINVIIDAEFEKEKETNPSLRKKQDDYGNFNWPRFQKFSQDRNNAQADMYGIHPSVINQIIELLSSSPYNMEVEFKSGAKTYQLSGSASPRTSTDKPSGSMTQMPDIQVMGEESTQYGKRLAIRFLVPFARSKAIFDQARRELPRGSMSYGQGGKFYLNHKDEKSFQAVKELFTKANLNIKPLLDWKPKEEDEEDWDDEDEIVYLTFEDLPADKIRVKISYFLTSPDQKEFLRENVQYSFPSYVFDKSTYSYIVGGTLNQYAVFGKTLNLKGYNIDKLREIVSAKIASGRLKKTETEGRYDTNKEFINSVDQKLPNLKFDLYDQQKFGVAFLYGRNSAVLGDETGLGKTVQLVSAAELKMRETNRPTLIITTKATQDQWVEQILSVIGEDKTSLVTTNPLTPKRYTVVYYDNFSKGKKVSQYVQSLINANFGIVIFDELHKVKHRVSKTSQNLAEVVKNIPTRWGASATISSNAPIDVRNQLMILGHHLGQINEKKFKRDFGGVGRDGGKPTIEDKIKAAERLNRWLNLSGVYVRRAKSDVRDMPNIEIGDNLVPVDQRDFNKMYLSKLSRYKDSELAISKLIAARDVLATLKTEETANKAIQIVKAAEGKNAAAGKIVIFTNFVDAARNLVEKINSKLKAFNPDYSVLTYLSDTSKSERSQVKSRFTNDPNAKVLVMSMRMGGTGIDFPNAAQNMLINDFDWTPEAAEQSEGRIYRINTNHPVKIQYIITDGLDQSLFEKVQQKREIAKIIQRYRQQFLATENDEKTLQKLVDAQKEMQKLDQEMFDAVAKELPGAEDALKGEIS